MQNIFKVLNITEPRSYNTKEGTTGYSRDFVLQMPGGPWADKFVATLFNSEAAVPFKQGDLVLATISCFTHDFSGRTYQDNSIGEIIKLN